MRWAIGLLAASGVLLGSQVDARPSAVFVRAHGPKGRIALPKAGVRLALFHYWASWCRPCREELPKLAAFMRSEAYRGLERRGVAIYVLSVDDPDTKLSPFLKRYGVSDMRWGLRGSLEQLKGGGGSGALPATVLFRPGSRRVVGRWEGAVDWGTVESKLQRLLVKE